MENNTGFGLPKTESFMRCNIGDHVLVRDLQSNSHDYGLIVDYDRKTGTLILERPSRYTLTKNGFKKQPTTVRTHTKIELTKTLQIITEEEMQAYAPIVPQIEMLGQDVNINISGNNKTGRIHQVFPATIILNPYIGTGINEEGTTTSRIYKANLPIPTEKILQITPTNATLEEILAYNNKQ